ncbi:MAG: hypothetical protein PVG41_00890 [Desulfobacteraceae bacterium]|jgi:protease I
MRLTGKTIGILVGPAYEDLEFWVPLMRLQEEGAQVQIIASKSDETYTSKSGGLIVKCLTGVNFDFSLVNTGNML